MQRGEGMAGGIGTVRASEFTVEPACIRSGRNRMKKGYCLRGRLQGIVLLDWSRG